MNMCKFSNLLLAAMEYSFAGNTKDAIVNKEINLPELSLVICVFIIWFIGISWWIISLRHLIDLLHLNDIKFKCDDK